jgi:hypothetical protein
MTWRGRVNVAGLRVLASVLSQSGIEGGSVFLLSHAYTACHLAISS